MKRLAIALVAAGLAVQPAVADEFSDVLESALEAYRDGDVQMAKEDLEYALRLLAEMKAAGLTEFLPEPLAGWEREVEDAQAASALAMFGGGTAATARYSRGAETFSITLMADSPMISGMAAMFSGMASMGGGRSVRIQRQQFSVTDDEIQGVVGGRVLVQASGDAPVEDIQAHLEQMDFRALGDF